MALGVERVVARLQLDVGPVPSAGVRAWVRWAQNLTGQLRRAPRTPAPSGRALETFDAYLRQWDSLAKAQDVFRWRTRLDADDVEYLLHIFHTVMRQRAVGADGRMVLAPAQGRPFYELLTGRLLIGLTGDGGPRMAFAESVRSSWPDPFVGPRATPGGVQFEYSRRPADDGRRVMSR